jgi:hypothetical protein
MAEQVGDVSLQARCLAYLTVTYRRLGRPTETGICARRGLAVAEAAFMLDYIGANRASLAWVAWQRGVTSTSLSASLAEAEQLAQAAMEVWRRFAMPYPFYWQALWPLIGAALAQNRPADAIFHAKKLCDPSQQILPSDIEEPLHAALAAWDAGQSDEARNLLLRAFDLAQQTNFS